SSQVELDTSPMAAEALAPRLPTIVASMYCMAVAETWASTAGMLSCTTVRSWSRSAGARVVAVDMETSDITEMQGAGSAKRAPTPHITSYRAGRQVSIPAARAGGGTFIKNL